VFQHRLAEALAAADGAVIARVDRLEQLPPENRLYPERLAADLRAAGRQALHEPDVAAIIERLQGWAGAGDVIVVFSNGGFDNIHERLLARLREQDAP